MPFFIGRKIIDSSFVIGGKCNEKISDGTKFYKYKSDPCARSNTGLAKGVKYK